MMQHKKAILFLVCLGLVTACNSYEPVPVTACAEVVSHARKLLGDKADSWSEMDKSCKAASDQERGCVMVADSAADILRCSR